MKHPALCIASTTVVLAVLGCAPEPTSSCCSTAPAAVAPLPGSSVWQLAAQCRDQTGRERQLTDFRGRPVLITMVFTHCAYACPTIAADLKAVLAHRPHRTDLHVVMVSMDPARDDPAALTTFAERHQLPAERFTLLQPRPEDVPEIAAVLGIRYSPADGGDFSHSNVLTLLDQDGAVAARIEGLGADAAPLLAAWDRLPAAPVR